MKNSLFTLIIFLLMFNNIMAQNKIEGKYGLLDYKGKALISPSIEKISKFDIGIATNIQSDEYGIERFNLKKN